MRVKATTGYWLMPLLFSCGSAGINDNSTGEIMKTSELGDFRGIEMGAWPDDVLNKEGRDVLYAMPDELTYRIPLEEKDSTFYEITYNFSDAGLYDIELKIYPRDDDQRHLLSHDFSALYAERYGQATDEKHYRLWKFMTARGRIVSILLNDSLEINGRPCLKINFNEYNR
jgi:hypothetical protein